eukprot:GFKZ01013403.1.p1 GENE.GFKZ01013403.1~~GFKZ01013403.1.p1  ORF type:complete len:684 (+),score=91.43 GFKZ01013403.1:151-2202(+)
MTEAGNEDPAAGPAGASYRMTVDPEVDAAEALKSLRALIISDIEPADAQLVSSWHGLDEYIEELCSCGVDKLSREPDELRSSCARLRGDLEEVSCGNYRALIESFECAGAVREGVAEVRARLDQLVEALPKLAEATRQFSIDVVERQKERETTLRAMTEERAISDILEMPRLMTSLIDAELYDEALELREYAMKMAVVHFEERLIMDVCGEMGILTQQMVLQLLVVLKNPVQLPMCLRVVGFLRRLGVFSEFRLRMLFLQCRGEWMRSGIESSAASTQQAQLVALSDSTRAMVFEIITQYRAVFNDSADADDEEDDICGDISPEGIPPNLHSSAILFDWTLACVADYLERLQAGIRDIRDGAALNTVLQQAMYCGQSLGRVGADFRSVLPPMFEEAVLRIYNTHLNAALRQFEMMIEDNRWAPVGSSALRKERAQGYTGLAGNLNKDQVTEENSGESGEQYAPPVGVLDSPPLAVFLNGILAALNELRLCAPVSLGLRLGRALHDVLVNAGDFMSAVGGPGGAFLKRSDRPHFAAMTASLRDLCVPHAARCLDHCMNRNGLVNVAEVKSALTDIFGDSLPPVALSRETAARLNGTESSLLRPDDPNLNNAGINDEVALGEPEHDPMDVNGKRTSPETEPPARKYDTVSEVGPLGTSAGPGGREVDLQNGSSDSAKVDGDNLIL